MSNEQLLSEEEWATVVKQELDGSDKFKIVNINSGPLNDEVNGFLGDHIRVVISVSLGDKDASSEAEEKQLKFFLKRLPRKYEFQTNYVISTGAFDKEIDLYSIFQHFKEVLSEVEKDLEISVNCDEYRLNDRETLWYPKCLYTRHETIVLEDLAEKGFRISDFKDFRMDFSHCTLVLQGLAAMHATSFIVEERKRKISGNNYTLLDDYSSSFVENFIVNEGGNLIKLWIATSLDALGSLLPYLTKYGADSEHQPEVTRKFLGICERMFDLVKPSRLYRNVLCHGDLWVNNIMFRYDEDQKKPQEVRFVDFQMVRYTPPAADLMIFLHANTDLEFRNTHLEAMLKLYHERLSYELRRYGMDVSGVLPWKVFRESCTCFQQLGRIMACLYHHFLLLPSDVIKEGIDGPDGYRNFVCKNRDEEIQRAFLLHEDYRHRMTEDLEDLIDNSGVLL